MFPSCYQMIHKRRAAVDGRCRWHNTGSQLFDWLCCRSKQGRLLGGGSEKLGESPHHHLKRSPNTVWLNSLEFSENGPSRTESWSNCFLYQEGDFRASNEFNLVSNVVGVNTFNHASKTNHLCYFATRRQWLSLSNFCSYYSLLHLVYIAVITCDIGPSLESS